ncbi:NUDIX domain-containing protein [uncultured Methanobrevibacter sp.]|uniref:NUDIX domain-containing protein n=1 Tax=uncultured Methanobrevibacter sp. TaxID=253161 RepID=UPI0026153637
MNTMWGMAVRGICEYDGKYLLLKIRSASSHDAGKWEFPGGKVKRSEFFDEALKREYLEETGLEIDLVSLYNTLQHDYVACKTGEKVKSIQIIMKVTANSDEVTISNEHDMYGWFTKEEIKEMIKNNQLTPPAKRALCR